MPHAQPRKNLLEEHILNERACHFECDEESQTVCHVSRAVTSVGAGQSSSRFNLSRRSKPNLPMPRARGPHRISNAAETYGSMRHTGEDPALTDARELPSLRAAGQWHSNYQRVRPRPRALGGYKDTLSRIVDPRFPDHVAQTASAILPVSICVPQQQQQQQQR
ncbi:hypothetical protein MY4824_006610 [Beauveria thailandica]